MMIRLTLILLTLAVLSCGKPKESEKTPVSTDYEAAVLTEIESAKFVDLEGNPVLLADLKGKVVLMDFWETWCGPCLQSFPTIERLVKEYPNDFAVLAITPGFSDTPEMVKEFKAQNPYPFQFVMDTGLASKLNIEGIPFKIFISSEGQYLKTVMGRYPDDYEKMKGIIEKHRRS